MNYTETIQNMNILENKSTVSDSTLQEVTTPPSVPLEPSEIEKNQSPPPKDRKKLSLSLENHVRMSRQENSNFSKEIMQRLQHKADPERIESRLHEDYESGLDESAQLIDDIHQKLEFFIACSEKYATLILIMIGIILNVIEDFLRKKYGSKSKYIQWVREKFKHNHTRRFQQAKQLARIKEFATKYASIGKNRLLEIYRIYKYYLDEEQTVSLEEIVERYPFPDTDKDSIHNEEGYLTTVHIDAIITIERLKKEQIGFVNFSQAQLIAMYKKRAMELKEISRLKKYLMKQENQEQAFQNYVQNHCFITGTSSGKKDSLESFLQRFIARYEDFGPNQMNLIKKKVESGTLHRMKEIIDTLLGEQKAIGE